jgi:hypothetical protein
MTMDDKEIQNDIWMININDTFHQSIKNKLIILANDLNITFIDEELLKFEYSQTPEIKRLIEQFIEKNNIQSNILELTLIG